MTCAKRCFTSERAARKGHSRAGYRLRAYLCEECGFYHTTNMDKNGTSDYREAPKPHRRGRGHTYGLAPVMTLEELEARAAEMRSVYTDVLTHAS